MERIIGGWGFFLASCVIAALVGFALAAERSRPARTCPRYTVVEPEVRVLYMPGPPMEPMVIHEHGFPARSVTTRVILGRENVALEAKLDRLKARQAAMRERVRAHGAGLELGAPGHPDCTR